MSELSAIDGIVCLAYLGVVVGLALGSMRGQRDNEDYFVGGRRMNWLAVGVSLFATSFSSLSFLGLPQRGAYQDFSFYLVILGIPLVITPILWFFFVPLYTRLRVSSGYQYLRLRFGRAVQRAGSILYCGYALGWMGAMLYAIALTLQGVMNLTPAQYVCTLIGLGAFATAYTAVGGLRAVVWTDVLQAATLGGAVLVVLLLAVGRIDGGWSGLWQIGREHGRFSMFHLDANPLASRNFTEANSLYAAGAFVFFMYLPGYAVAQNMIQRYVCTGGVSRARGVVLLSAGVNALLGFVFMLVGVALFAFYSQPGGPGMPAVASQDQILPHFVSTQAPGVGLVGIMLAGMFAAAMSTIDSGINGVASVIVYDWLEGRQLPLRASRVLTAVLGALVIAAALIAPLLGDNVIEIINTIAGTLLGGLMAVFLLGMFVPRANTPGVLIGLAFGAACLLAVIALTGIPKWWYGAFTVFPTLLVGAAASYLFPPPAPEAIESTLWARPHRRREPD
ncbi:MAG: sodium/solute symporter [Candidatus Hydrogenedentes bacterium]|nr:sodium/solute symporter [Candidatus Hydrogenedentota bacterium]